MIEQKYHSSSLPGKIERNKPNEGLLRMSSMWSLFCRQQATTATVPIERQGRTADNFIRAGEVVHSRGLVVGRSFTKAHLYEPSSVANHSVN
eukprot:3607144-Amphidinium_carterae.1